MPLLDHFKAPLSVMRPWEGIHGNWATKIADQLNLGVLPPDYVAISQVTVGGQVEVDVGTFHEATSPGNGPVATAVWAPPRPTLSATLELSTPDVYEIGVFQEMGGPQLRAAIELVSPRNKDRPQSRHAFAVKCAAYLHRRVSLIVIDVVTERQSNMHTELVNVLQAAPSLEWRSTTNLYAVAYQLRATPANSVLEVWPESLQIGAALPAMPLWLSNDLCVPLRLEESYQATCASLRIML
jgi:hypothetical protein